ncbi:serine hydrolase domain-containing protein [Deinococcus hohokamensis]|uniref:Serine hydrolase domain-containing protein n=1 Tax=Deinococcus hohokamensis TaxID=309883 RepID=A0ABV9I8I6_9DEIO
MRPLLLLSALLASTATALDPRGLEAAAAYSRDHRGSALLVMQGGQVLFSEGQNGFALAQPHLLASGSKSFSCALAVALSDQGVLSLDERVSATLTEWATDPLKNQITVRHLLNFTSGLPARIGPSAARLNADLFGSALRAPLEAPPGHRYTYGNAHLAAFGLLVQRKTGLDPAAVLQRRVLDRIGVRAQWARDRKGQPNLAGSASMTALDWATYGQLILQGGVWKGARVLSREGLDQCFRGSSALATYGLTWWLNVPFAGTLDAEDEVPVQAMGAGSGGAQQIAPSAPSTLVMAAGALNQRLYLLPDEGLVVVRFGEGGPWSDEGFLARLLGKKPQGSAQDQP